MSDKKDKVVTAKPAETTPGAPTENQQAPDANNGATGETAPPATTPEDKGPDAKKQELKKEPVIEAKRAEPKKVTVRGLEDHECFVAGQKYFIKKDFAIEVPEDVCAILQAGRKAIRVS